MLHLIPAPLHRALYRIADRVRHQWWRLAKPRRRSVNVIAADPRGHVVLVRHSYGSRAWLLPGGGIGRHEDPLLGALREFREELGCGLEALWPLAEEEAVVSSSLDLQHVVAARLAGTPVADMREVVEVGLFDPAALPEDTGRLTRARIAAWQERMRP